MRLGGFFSAGSIADLDSVCDKLDCYGLSAIPAPRELAAWSDDDCAAFGERARRLGIVVGEVGFWENLLTDDAQRRDRRISTVRTLLRKADIMGCRCVVTLVGSKDPSDCAVAPHPYVFSDAGKREFREIVLRILDGLDLRVTKYGIEPWCTTFFYQPEDIRAFIDSVGHPAFGLHLDQMNMVNHKEFYNTTALINRTFHLLADNVVSVHLKDLRWDASHMFMKWDECYIGDGVMDYDTYLKRLAGLAPDMPCFCEHFKEERDYAVNFARLHHLAAKAGVRFLRRVE